MKKRSYVYLFQETKELMWLCLTSIKETKELMWLCLTSINCDVSKYLFNCFFKQK